MVEDESNGEIEKGKLLYTSPRCPLSRRIKVGIPIFFVFSLFFFPGLLLFVYGVWKLVVEGDAQEFVRLMFGSLIAFLAAFGLLFELASNEMYKHYRIYEKGITDVSAHFNPFSNCDKLMTKGEENFYLWDVFEGFKKKETEDELLIMLYVDMGVFNKALKEGGVRPKNLSIYYPKDPVGKVAFDDVVSILKKVVGNEIHYTCRVCRTITSEGKDRCDNCVKHGYEEN